MKRIVLLLSCAALTATAGCWREMGRSYLDPDFGRERVVTIAVLPVINQTEEPLAVGAVLGTLARQLSREKKYAVLPNDKVMARLRSGGGGAAFVQMMNKVARGEEPPPDLYAQMARGLDADALFQETVVSYHHLREDVIAPTSSGAAAYQQVPVTVVEVKGSLWGARSRVVLWRDEAIERYYHDPTTEGDGTAAPAVDQATHELLAHFPENTWQPRSAPTPTPVPSPVTSFTPIFRTPADPNEPQP